MRKLSLKDSEKEANLTDEDYYRPRRGRPNAKVAAMSNGEKRSAMRGIMSRRSSECQPLSVCNKTTPASPISLASDDAGRRDSVGLVAR